MSVVEIVSTERTVPINGTIIVDEELLNVVCLESSIGPVWLSSELVPLRPILSVIFSQQNVDAD